MSLFSEKLFENLILFYEFCSRQRKLFENFKKFKEIFSFLSTQQLQQQRSDDLWSIFAKITKKKKTKRRHLNFPAKVTSDAAAN
jgi:hypothetical protein